MSESAPEDPWSGYSAAPEDRAELVPLASRRAFDRDLALAAQERPRRLALLALDIDHFKKVNDTYGHPIGDKVLIRVAHAVRATVGRRGRAYRCGGEEFMALLPGFTEGEAAAVAERLRRTVEAIKFDTGEPPRVTASFGVAEFSEEEPIADFVKRADDALYRAKGGGRNRVTSACGDYGQKAETHTAAPVVLIVNEQRAIRDTLGQFLAHEGFEVLTPLEAHEAINLVARNPIVAFVSLDFQDGSVAVENFVRAIKGRAAKARVYAMTSYGTQDRVAEAIGRGVDGVLLNPVRVEEVLGLTTAARDHAPAPPIL